MKNFEYSQTLILDRDFNILGTVDTENHSTKVTIKDASIAKGFYSACESWDIYGTSLELVDGVLEYGPTPLSAESYNYNMFMNLILQYLNKDFKEK